MKAPSSLRQKWTDLGIIFLLKSDDDLKVQAPKGVLTSALIEEIRPHKPNLIRWLKTRNSEDCPLTEALPSTACSFIAHASSEEVMRYRLLIEELFSDPSQDELSKTDLPQKFRNGTISFEEMQNAVTSLMEECQKETTRLDISSLGLLGFNEREKAIILSYPVFMHPFLKSLVRISKSKAQENSYSWEQLNNFQHNMRHLFVEIRGKQDQYSANLSTLCSDDWTEETIIQFMMAQKVKYILCHNMKVIQCLDLEDKVYVFEQKKALEHKPVMDTP